MNRQEVERDLAQWRDAALKFSDDYHAELTRRIDAESRLASVKALALEEAAAALDALQTPGNEHYSQRDPALWLHNRAAELRAATESKEVGQ